MKEAYFAGGCFWCMEKPYDSLDGVTEARSGYCGGEEEDPAYEQVKAQQTSHRETVRVIYDPEKLSFRDLLAVYFYHIDPFDGEGQFIDRGRSYTCAVYWTDEEQRRIAEEAVSRIEAESGRKVFVAVEEFRRFWPAEEYHQHYAEKNPEAYRREFEESGRAAVREEDRIRLTRIG